MRGVLSLEADMLNPGGLITGSFTNIALISSNGSTTLLAGKKCYSINLMINFQLLLKSFKIADTSLSLGFRKNVNK